MPRSCGVGVVLVSAADLSVEDDNPRGRVLYERLGYLAHDRRPEAWDEEAPYGTVRRHEPICTVMRKDLA